MIYYMKLETDTPDIIQYDSGKLGETTPKSFYPEKGFTRFIKIANEFPELLEKAVIFDETAKRFTPEDFLKKIEKLKIMEL